MTIKRVAPFGDWESPIGVDSVTSKSKTLTSPRVSSISGRAFYVESGQSGGHTIVELTNDGLEYVLPDDFSVENKVYEYGGSLYDVLTDDRIIFSNKDDTVRILDPDTKEVRLVVQNPVLRYSSFSANGNTPWVLAIEEDHTHNTPSEIRNYVVAINSDTFEVKRIVTHADFYYMPQFNHNGTKVLWLEWNHPDMLFDASELYWADWSNEGISNVRLISGDNQQSVAEPRWGPDGSLFFCQELSEYRRLFRIRPGADEVEEIKLDGLDEAEFGEMRLFEGSRSYAPLSAEHLVASACVNGQCKLIVIGLEDSSWRQLAEPELICHINFDAISRLNESSVLAIGSGIGSLSQLLKVDIRQGKDIEIVRKSTEDTFPAEYYSRPEHIRVESKGAPSRAIHGFLWMPRNPQYTAPEGELPPLVIFTHGGPTGYNGCGLALRTQYFTSRGYAYLFLNYSGSTGHGRSYRQKLFGSWGEIDADDAAEVADYFVNAGRVKPGSVAISGHSAGGFNTLQVLVRHSNTFAAGFCVAGISELKRFDETTHKLESDYAPALLLPKGSSPEDKDRIYKERSALYHTDAIESPLVLLHGKADTIVPIEQATLVEKALRAKGNDVKLVAIEDEGHMMGKPTSQRIWLEEEEQWWRKTLL